MREILPEVRSSETWRRLMLFTRKIFFADRDNIKELQLKGIASNISQIWRGRITRYRITNPRPKEETVLQQLPISLQKLD